MENANPLVDKDDIQNLKELLIDAKKNESILDSLKEQGAEYNLHLLNVLKNLEDDTTDLLGDCALIISDISKLEGLIEQFPEKQDIARTLIILAHNHDLMNDDYMLETTLSVMNALEVHVDINTLIKIFKEVTGHDVEHHANSAMALATGLTYNQVTSHPINVDPNVTNGANQTAAQLQAKSTLGPQKNNARQNVNMLLDQGAPPSSHRQSPGGGAGRPKPRK